MKYEKISKIITDVVRFTNKHKIDVELNIFTASELSDYSESQSTYWAIFEKLAGTYCFFSDKQNEVLYVGMSKSDTGSRIYNWLYKDNKILDHIENEDLILLISYTDQNYMAPALECYLIDRYSPLLNKTR